MINNSFDSWTFINWNSDIFNHFVDYYGAGVSAHARNQRTGIVHYRKYSCWRWYHWLCHGKWAHFEKIIWFYCKFERKSEAIRSPRNAICSNCVVNGYRFLFQNHKDVKLQEGAMFAIKNLIEKNDINTSQRLSRLRELGIIEELEKYLNSTSRESSRSSEE